MFPKGIGDVATIKKNKKNTSKQSIKYVRLILCTK